MSEHALIVDTESGARTVLGTMLRELSLSPLLASSMSEAKEMLATVQVDLVVADLAVSQDDGDLLKWCKLNVPGVPVVFLVERHDLASAMQALENGAHSFLTKPFEMEKLKTVVDSALALRRMREEEANLRKEVERKINRLRQQLVDEVVQKEMLFMATLTSLAKAIDARDSYTHDHSAAVAEYAKRTARVMGHDVITQERIHTAGLLHDIGKIAVPEDILLKPGRLTDAEYETIKSHPVRGAEILAPLPDVEETVTAVRSHHERYDGTGYPDCLQGKEIPLYARILGVCDAWDAMTTDRPYRKGMPFNKARDIIVDERGTQFDPQVVSAFLEIDHAGVLSRLHNRKSSRRFIGSRQSKRQ